jgi:hypothetical protein
MDNKDKPKSHIIRDKKYFSAGLCICWNQC